MSKIAGGFLAASFLVVTGAWGQLNYATPYDFMTIAGLSGTQGYQDGTNSGAQFAQPDGLTLDASGNVYVVDNGEDTVRQMTPVGTNWVVTTIAGTPLSVSGTSGGFNDGTNGSIGFDGPTDIAIDAAGNLYVTDSNNNTVRKLTRVGTNWVSSTIAGTPNSAPYQDGTNGAALFNDPLGFAVDAKTNVYVADTFNNVIRRISPVGTNWVTTTIAGVPVQWPTYGGFQDGTNRAALFDLPSSLAVDGSGNLFVTDSGNSAIRKMTPMGTNWVTTTIAGDGTAGAVDGTNGAAEFDSDVPGSDNMEIAVDAYDHMYVTDGGNSVVRKVSPLGTNWVTTTLAGSLGSQNVATDGTGANATFAQLAGIGVNAAGRLFVSDEGAADMRAGTLVPGLTLSLIVSNKVAGVIVSWPTAVGFTVQTNSDLRTAAWGNYSGPVNTTNAVSSLTVLPAAGNVFFRLAN